MTKDTVPKTGAERTKEYLTLRRQRARETGLCITCCTRKPRVGYSVCSVCNSATARRVLRKRRQDRAAGDFQQVIQAHERAGDSVRDQHAYEAAAQHYKFALDAPTITDNDRTRIEEKLAYALFLGPNPEAADPWLERVLTHTLEDPEKTVKLLAQKRVQLWAKAEGINQRPLFEKAMDIAKNMKHPHLLRLMHMRLANYLVNLGEADLAATHLVAAGGVVDEDDAKLRRAFYPARAIIFAQRGNALEARADFDRAISAAQEGSDASATFALVNDWMSYAIWMCALGDIEQAKSFLERAFLVVRSNQISWLLPYVGITYAEILARMGQVQAAHHYACEALGAATFAPVVETAIAEIGIPIALLAKDEVLLTQCARPQALERAFALEIPTIIGPVSAAFTALYMHQGKVQEARRLLHRVLPMIPHVDQNWNFMIAVVRYGASGDIAQARALLEQRAALPSSSVTVAYLHLFDAFLARRRKQITAMRRRAAEAAELFETLRWHGLAEEARSLLPATSRSVQSVQRFSPSINLQVSLTARERDVAELIVRGQTNRAIAQTLAISEKTVEAHITSIMNRLGIRSRYQLTEVLPEEERAH